MLTLAKVIARTTAEGPHERLALWVAGCTLACPGCCNPDLFDPAAGDRFDAPALERLLDRAAADGLDGVTVLGGEPLQQLDGLTRFLAAAHARRLGTIVYTGYPLEQARALPGFSAMWERVDTIVDGPFDARRPELRRRFIGSANQRLQHRTERYADPSLWRGPTRVEIHVDAQGNVEAHGLPRSVARIRRALNRD